MYFDEKNIFKLLFKMYTITKKWHKTLHQNTSKISKIVLNKCSGNHATQNTGKIYLSNATRYIRLVQHMQFTKLKLYQVNTFYAEYIEFWNFEQIKQ